MDCGTELSVLYNINVYSFDILITRHGQGVFVETNGRIYGINCQYI